MNTEVIDIIFIAIEYLEEMVEDIGKGNYGKKQGKMKTTQERLLEVIFDLLLLFLYFSHSKLSVISSLG